MSTIEAGLQPSILYIIIIFFYIINNFIIFNRQFYMTVEAGLQPIMSWDRVSNSLKRWKDIFVTECYSRIHLKSYGKISSHIVCKEDGTKPSVNPLDGVY